MLHPSLTRQVKTAPTAFLLTVTGGVLGGAVVILQAWLLSRVIAGAVVDGLGLGKMIVPVFSLLVVILLRVGLHYLTEASAADLAVKVKDHLRRLLLEKLFALGPAFTLRERSAELTTAAIQGVEALDAYFSQYLPQLIMAAIIPLGILVVVFPLDWLSAGVLLLTAPLIPLFLWLIGTAAEGLTRRQWKTLRRMSAHFLDLLQGLCTLKHFNRSRDAAARVGEVSRQFANATLAVLRVSFLSALVLELVATLSTAIVAVELGLRLLDGRILFAEAFFLLLLAPEFYLPLRQLGVRFHAGTAGVSSAKSIFAILDQPLPTPAQPSATQPNLKKLLSQPGSRLVIEKAHFTYPGRDEPVLQGLSLTIPTGMVTALIGESGSGKSTLARLLLRFYALQQGSIRVGDIPLEQIPLEEWRRLVCWIPQRAFIFNNTIRANLLLARQEASDAEVWQALEQAQLAKWVKELPGGLDYSPGEAARLSAGQAARLALARAFLMDAPLVILDEPGAYLDPQTDASLVHATRQLSRQRTVVVIAHRLASIRHADQICILSQGRLAEAGSHDDLLSARGMYARLLSGREGL
jgi:ATP-binding cassette subfamily C protein CydD